jgi:murein DD-endopeptidase MepM/ murein hydrolase activator NlpD
MPERQWTVVVVSSDETGVRQFRVSRERARLAVALIILIFAAALSGVVGATGGPAAEPNQRLVRTNTLLQSELDQLTLQIDSLRSALDGLAVKDEHYRLLAGLDPMDAGVRMVGIGGPGLPTAEGSALFDADRDAARRTFAASSQVNALLRRARLISFSWREAEDSLSEKRHRLESLPSISPASGFVSSSFARSRWHPILDRPRPHTGIDIAAPIGTPVVAAAKGRVAFVGPQGDYGTMIDIDHGYGHTTRYAHLSRTTVRTGQLVMRGDTIGAVGQSGLATGPHLHYEVLVDGKSANPRRYIMDFRVVPE